MSLTSVLRFRGRATAVRKIKNTERERDRQTGRQAGRQTDRQTDRERHIEREN